MNRFSRTEAADPATAARAASINARADVLQAQGRITAEERARCWNLYMLTKLVQEAEEKNKRWSIEYYTMSSHVPVIVTIDAPNEEQATTILWADEDQRYCPAQVMRVWEVVELQKDVELPDSFDTPAPADTDEADHEAETAHARHGF